ncbi:DUF2752 domain-containing protein [Olivibacter jilunii]|uniref:DUF2752 domain-containing protein n=1 Tax=Olivibacter jilunii TaxID=985016 RepID=UPI003F17EBD5
MNYLLFLIFSSWSGIDWLQHHLLPCPFKWLTGIDCPGCGFQRALLLLFQGRWQASIVQYPPTIPLLLLGLFFLLKNRYFKKNEKLATVLSCLVGFLIITSYLNKMF